MPNEQTPQGKESVQLLTPDEMAKPIQKQFTGQFVAKERFTGKHLHVVTCNVTIGQYKRYLLEIKEPGKEYTMGWVNLGAHNVNEFIDLFGPAPKDWLNKDVVVTGERFDAKKAKAREGRELSSGFVLHFSKWDPNAPPLPDTKKKPAAAAEETEDDAADPGNESEDYDPDAEDVSE